MSPYCHKFKMFRSIDSQPINVADKTVFKAIAVGDMDIAILNGNKNKHVTLKNVWYCPELAFMLISIGCCDAASYLALFKQKKCTIRDPHRTLVSSIPLMYGLYKVQHQVRPNESANVAQPTLSLNQFHCHMGHISPTVAKCLVKENIITGLKLDMSSESMFCMACAKAKPTQVPVPKEWSSPRATKLGDKVHLDIWGPSTPESYNGHKYFVAFTDNHTC